ncbi:hypothetical protein VP01_5564g1, partial [Puccinia sorghi]
MFTQRNFKVYSAKFSWPLPFLKPDRSGEKFCTPGMKPPDNFEGENSLKLQGFLQSCKLLFSNDPTV